MRGFTLIELVVALFIFALLATAGTALLSVSIKSQNAVVESLDRNGETGRILALFSTDLAQAVPRATRNSDGADDAAFVGRDGKSDGVILAYVRADATGIQRVEWRREGPRLVRTSKARLDGGGALRSSIMTNDVAQISLRYRYKGEWRADWFPTRLDALPQAVELSVAQAGGQPVRALFVAGVGQP